MVASIYNNLLFLYLQILTAVTTTCAALAKMHTREILDLVRMDLDEEQEENEYLFYGSKHRVTPNESKLQLSEQYVSSKYLKVIFGVWQLSSGNLALHYD